MGANLVYLDRPNTKKDTIAGTFPGNDKMVPYKWACS